VVLSVSVREEATSSVLTWQHYVSLYTNPFVYSTFLNTLGFALTTTAVALLIGVAAAWLVERSDLKGKSLVFTFLLIGLLMPGFFTAMGWLMLLHPKIGLVNQAVMGWFGLSSAPFNIVSVPGMGWVQGLGLASLTFIMVSASMRAMDPALEEAAQISGATFLSTMRHITLPLAVPGILAAALYVVTIGISAFDVPAIIGLTERVFTFSTFLYYETHPPFGLPKYGPPAAFASFMIVAAGFLSWWYGQMLAKARNYQVVTGKNYRPKLVELGRWSILAWLFLGTHILLSKIVPLLLLIWATFVPYLQVPSVEAFQTLTFRHIQNLNWDVVFRGLSHTVTIAVIAPTIALAFSFLFSWVVLRGRSRFRFALDYIAFLPHAVPHIIFALGALLVALFVLPRNLDLYGTVALLVIIYALVQLSFGTRVTNSALIQIQNELEEAAYVSGATPLTVMRRILLPLLRPALVYGWLWLALLSFRELTMATMLFSRDNVTLSVVVWNLWNTADIGRASAVTLIMILALAPLILLYWRFAGRQGIQ
jgi:iron(III) transport system permease protein